MTDEERIKHYKAYLAAFNTKSYEGIKSYIHPDCTVNFRGKKLAHSREDMLPTYPAHWAKMPSPIELREIRPIKDGVWTMLRSPDDGNYVEVEYFYNEEGLFIHHNIIDAKPFATKESEDGVTSDVQ